MEKKKKVDFGTSQPSPVENFLQNVDEQLVECEVGYYWPSAKVNFSLSFLQSTFKN